MLSTPASCLEFHVCYEWQFLSYLSTAAQTRLYPEMFPCKSHLDCHPLTFHPANQTAGETLTNVCQTDLTLTALWQSLFHSPPSRPGRWHPADTLTQLRGPCIVALRLLGVSLYGTALAFRRQTMTMKMFCSWMTVPMLCCHNACQLNIRWWRPLYAHAEGHFTLIWSHDLWISRLHLLQHFYLQMGSCRNWNQQFFWKKNCFCGCCLLHAYSLVSWKNIFVFPSFVKGTLQSRFMVLISFFAMIAVLNKDKISGHMLLHLHTISKSSFMFTGSLLVTLNLHLSPILVLEFHSLEFEFFITKYWTWN